MTQLDEQVVAAAEADLQQLLAIEPSPELAARIRARIDDAEPGRWWRWGWIGLALATASVIVVAFVLMRNHQPPVGAVVQIVRSPDTRLSVPPVTPEDLPVRPSTHRHDATGHRAAQVAKPSPTPEIIIDPAVTAAIQRLAAGTRNTTLDLSTGESIAADAQAGALAVAEPLSVPELALKPVDTNGGQ